MRKRKVEREPPWRQAEKLGSRFERSRHEAIMPKADQPPGARIVRRIFGSLGAGIGQAEAARSLRGDGVRIPAVARWYPR